MTLRCILCGGCGIEHLTKLSSRTLREAYLEHLGVMQQWMVRKTAKLFSSYMRRALQHSNLRPIGHSVVAIYALD